MDLLADADALVENFAPRVMPSLGLDADTLRRHKPQARGGVGVELRADGAVARLSGDRDR